QDVRIFAPPSSHRDLSSEDLHSMSHWNRETFNCRKDGSIFPVRITSDVVSEVKDGKLSGIAIVATCEDISERKRAEEALRLRQQVIESSTNGIMITD